MKFNFPLLAGLLFAGCLTAASALDTTTPGDADSPPTSPLFQFSGWGNGVFTPYAFSSNGSAVSASSSTWGSSADVQLTIKGTTSENTAGLIADMNWNGTTPGVGNNAKLWVRPWDWAKLTLGVFVEDDLRGTVGTSEFSSWILPNGSANEDGIFSRFQATGGAHVALTPVPGLYLEGALGSSLAYLGNGWAAFNNLLDNSAADVYKAGQFSLGYRLPGLGMVRAQFIGNNRNQLRALLTNQNQSKGMRPATGLSMNRDADVIELAVQMTAVQDLNLDFGVKIPSQFETDAQFTVYSVIAKPVQLPPLVTANGERVSVQLPYTLAMGATYSPAFLPGFTLLTRADYTFGGVYDDPDEFHIETASDLKVWINPSYKLSKQLSFGIDSAIEVRGPDSYLSHGQPVDVSQVSPLFDKGFGAWVKENLDGVGIKAGVMIMLPSSDRWAYDGTYDGAYYQILSGDPVVSFPISVTYSF